MLTTDIHHTLPAELHSAERERVQVEHFSKRYS